MSEEADPVKVLIAARDKFVEERRALSVAIVLGYRRRRTDDVRGTEMRETFIDLQKLIDAVCRAIEHEKMIKSEQPEASPIRVEGDLLVA